MNNHNLPEGNNTNSSCSFYKEEVKKSKNISNAFKNIFLYLFSVGLCLIVGAGISFSFNYIKDVVIPQYANDVVAANSTNDIVINDNNELVKLVIENASKSVVSITAITGSTNIFNMPISEQYESAGSGIIFHKTSSEVFIVTNYHVVENATQVGVAIGDNIPISAKLIGKDASADLAVISISTDALAKEGIDNVVVAKFTNSSNVLVGDYVVAIGNALGEGLTSTFGIVSSTNAQIYTSSTGDNFLQTTAAINPGNSGGALINLNGEVIGINTSKIVNTTVEGIGYTISSDVAMPIIEQIMNHTEQASLGVRITDVSNGNISISDEVFGGALIVEVIKDSSADKAKLQVNDIITSVNDTPILYASQLVEEIKKYNVSDTIRLKVIRDGEVKTIKVKLLQNSNSHTSF